MNIATAMLDHIKVCLLFNIYKSIVLRESSKDQLMEYVFISLIIFLTMFDVTLNTKELKTC